MKCAEVQSVLVEYSEGALGAADEMCIDIHLVQCNECRAELTDIHALVGAIAHEVCSCEECDDPANFLDRLRSIESAAPPRLRASSVAKTLARRYATAALAGFSMSLVLLGLIGPLRLFDRGSTETHVRDHVVSAQNWAPYLWQNRGLLDLDALGLVDAPARKPARFEP